MGNLSWKTDEKYLQERTLRIYSLFSADNRIRKTWKNQWLKEESEKHVNRRLKLYNKGVNT